MLPCCHVICCEDLEDKSETLGDSNCGDTQPALIHRVTGNMIEGDQKLKDFLIGINEGIKEKGEVRFQLSPLNQKLTLQCQVIATAPPVEIKA